MRRSREARCDMNNLPNPRLGFSPHPHPAGLRFAGSGEASVMQRLTSLPFSCYARSIGHGFMLIPYATPGCGWGLHRFYIFVASAGKHLVPGWRGLGMRGCSSDWHGCLCLVCCTYIPPRSSPSSSWWVMEDRILN